MVICGVVVIVREREKVADWPFGTTKGGENV